MRYADCSVLPGIVSKPSWSQVVGWRGACSLAALGLSSCLPVALPPARFDVGYGPYTATHVTEAPAHTGSRPLPGAVTPPKPLGEVGVLRASGGLHLASLLPPDRLPLDVGVGYVLDYFPGTDSRVVHGAYGEVSPVLVRGHGWRVLAGVRGELLVANQPRIDDGYGFYGRVAVESFGMVNGGGASGGSGAALAGVGYGVLAAGLYVEAGAQRLPGGDVTRLAVLGLTLRTPAAFGIMCCIK